MTCLTAAPTLPFANQITPAYLIGELLPAVSRFYLGNLGTLVFFFCALGAIACFGIAGALWIRQVWKGYAVVVMNSAEEISSLPPIPQRRKSDRSLA
jgi:hypothetical protein